jgi:hypothetical protein
MNADKRGFESTRAKRLSRFIHVHPRSSAIPFKVQ